MFYFSELVEIVVVTIASGGVAGVGHVSDIVRMSGSEGIRNRKSGSHLVGSVGVSLSLAVVVGSPGYIVSSLLVVVGLVLNNTVDLVSKVSSVAQSSVASHEAVAVVDARDDPTVGQAKGNLA